MLEKNLIRANEDIVTVSTIAQSMGWGGGFRTIFPKNIVFGTSSLFIQA